jgi:hypothetical protein
MVEVVLGKQQRKQIAEIPLSNDVISNRILDMSADVLDQLMEELKKVTLLFGLQLDESTDEAQCSQLLAFVRYATETCIKEDFLFCEPLLATTKAADVYQLIDEFFSKMDWTGRRNWASYALMVHLPCWERNMALELWCRWRPHRWWSFTIFYIVMHWLHKLFLQD